MHMERETQKERLIGLAKEHGLLRTRDVLAAGVHHETLRRLCDEKILEKSGRGLYKLVSEDMSAFHSYALAAKKAPNGVICLLSALLYHEITTQLPREVWMAFARDVRVPRMNYPRLRVVRFSRSAITEGCNTVYIENVPVNVTNPAKTIADCFKFRNKIGLDIALEALREGLRDNRCTRDELWHYAKLNRVSNVMRPYMEATI